MQRALLLFVAASLWVAGCGSETPKPAPTVETKPAEPAVPEEMTDATVMIDPQPDGTALIRLNGSAVAHVLTPAGLTLAHVGLAQATHAAVTPPPAPPPAPPPPA